MFCTFVVFFPSCLGRCFNQFDFPLNFLAQAKQWKPLQFLVRYGIKPRNRCGFWKKNEASSAVTRCNKLCWPLFQFALHTARNHGETTFPDKSWSCTEKKTWKRSYWRTWCPIDTCVFLLTRKTRVWNKRRGTDGGHQRTREEESGWSCWVINRGRVCLPSFSQKEER